MKSQFPIAMVGACPLRVPVLRGKCLCLTHPCFHPSHCSRWLGHSWEGQARTTHLTLIQVKSERKGTRFPLTTSDFAFSKLCAMFLLSLEVHQKARELGNPGVHVVWRSCPSPLKVCGQHCGKPLDTVHFPSCWHSDWKGKTAQH